MLDSCFIRNSSCVTRTIGGETIIIPVSGNVADLESIYTLNELGSSVWNRIDGKTPLATIIEEFRELYEVTKTELERDIVAFMEELKSLGLVHSHGAD